MAANWRLSPSDFAFLWEECRRCFYLKVVRRFDRPRAQMPGIFAKIDSMMKRYFDALTTADIALALPSGTVEFSDKLVESRPVVFPGHESTCFIRGKFDTVVRFDDGSYGVIDFKTSGAKGGQGQRYSRQLHSYAYALENPAPGRLHLAPVSRLGLLCVEPVEMLSYGEGSYAYRSEPAWIDCPKDDGAFMEFLREVLDVLDAPEPPQAGPDCRWCQYRDEARQNLL